MKYFVTSLLFLTSYLFTTYGMYSCSSTGTEHVCRLKTGEDLRHPEQLLSRFNILETELKVQMSKVTVGGWLELQRRTYNGKIGGATWRVKPGDSISVRLENKLGPNKKTGRMNSLRNPNTTNLYLHGLHVSPNSNDAALEVEPGESRSFTYKIACDHPSGTYWYHPHYHGSAMFQTLSGMAGMIVVEDHVLKANDPQYISYYSCPVNCDREVHLLFQPTLLYKIAQDGFSFARIQQKIGDPFRNRDMLSDGRTVEDWLISRQNKVSFFTTNGQIKPTIRIQAGRTMRFRMVNAGGIHVLEIMAPASCEVEEIARDGIYLAHPMKPRNGKSIIPQGGTMDWLIKCDSAGNFEIKSSPSIRKNPVGRAVRYNGVLALLEVIERPEMAFLKAALPTANFVEETTVLLPSSPKYMQDLMHVPSSDVTGKFVLETCVNNLLNRQKFNGSNSIVAYHMPLDGVEEWSLLNADPSNSHTLHIQGNHFQIISYDDYTGPVSIATKDGVIFVDSRRRLCQETGPTPSTLSLKKAGMGVGRADYKSYQGDGPAPVGQWRNVILLPALSNITVRFRPQHFIGTSLVFSHNLLRDDFGMKTFVQTVQKGKRSRTNVPNGGLPGTCRPGDYYPTVEVKSLILGKADFEGFFNWIYNLKPEYKQKYGDQRYLSTIYTIFLQQYQKPTPNGDHLTEFFEWAYQRFPSYRQYYGDQGYLAELYSYYLSTVKTQPRSHIVSN